MFIGLVILINAVMGSICNSTLLSGYQYNGASSGAWTYPGLSQISSCASPSPAQQVTLSTSQVAIGNLKIDLGYIYNDIVTVNSAGVPFTQYLTSNMQLTIQSVNALNSIYTSMYFDVRPPVYKFDVQTLQSVAEIHITFQLDSTYQSCQADLALAVLVFPVIVDNDYKYGIKFDPTLLNNTFNFRNNITNQIANTQTSYVTYSGLYNSPPCPQAHYYISTQPLISTTTVINALLKSNLAQTQSQIYNAASMPITKGTFWYSENDVYFADQDTANWTGLWAGAAGPMVVLAFLLCIYGQWMTSNIGRYVRPEHEERDEEANDNILQEEKLAEH